MKESYEQDHGKPLDFEEYLEHLNKDIEALLERLHENVKKNQRLYKRAARYQEA